jgi:hypothetical protein
VIFGLAWVYHELAQQAQLQLSVFLISMPVAIVWACTAIFLGLVVWYRRKTRAELVYILNVRRELGEDGPDLVDAGEKTGRIFGSHRRLRRGKSIGRV